MRPFLLTCLFLPGLVLANEPEVRGHLDWPRRDLQGPAAGRAPIVAYDGFRRLPQNQPAGAVAAAGDLGFKVLTFGDPVG